MKTLIRLEKSSPGRDRTTTKSLSVEAAIRHELAGGWHRFSLDSPGSSQSPSPAPALLGWPGLWKRSGKVPRITFEFPDAILTLRDAPESVFPVEASPASATGSPEEECDRWARHTASGAVPPDWSAPSAEWIAATLPPSLRAIRSGSLLREIEVIREDARLALRVVLTSLPDSLPAPRYQWLKKFVATAATQWRMARLGIDRDAGLVLAEIDFTGAPAAVLQPLFQVGVDSLRWIVDGLAETADFIAGTESVSEALEVLTAE